METISNNTIGSLVAANFKAASVFQKFGIDFCCNGNRTISEACASQNLNEEKVEQEVLSVLESKEKTVIDYNAWPIDLLADYIEKTHHRYVTEKIPELNIYLKKLCKVHGERHPELLSIYKHFLASAEELTMHMKKEENILFPFIRSMVKAENSQVEIDQPPFMTVKNPIAMMMKEHDTEGGRFREISKLSNEYTAPADGCTTYKVAFAMLKEFERDLHTHIHLENNILFPKAIILEADLV
jgi:regulator of cell morphogenesis and NO signaling